MKSVSRVYHMIPLSPFSAEVKKKKFKKKEFKKIKGRYPKRNICPVCPDLFPKFLRGETHT